MSASRPLIFRNSVFARLWIGQALAQTCTRMYQIAVTWWLLTQFPAEAGRISGAFLLFSALPSLMLVKKIGQVVDTHCGRSILLRSDLTMFAAALTIMGLALSGTVNAGAVFIAGFCLATLQAFYDPTLGKLAPSLVEGGDVEKAVGWMSSTQSLASFSGALVGAVLIERLGLGGIAALASGGYLFSAACNYGLPKKTPVPVSETPEQIESTFEVLRGLPEIRKILVGFGFVNFFLTPILVVLPLYVAQSLKGSASLLGIMEACLWAGLVLGSFLGGIVQIGKDKLTTAIVSLSVLSVCLMVVALIVNSIVYGASLVVLGTALGINNVKFVAYFQEQVADSVKGRFFAALQATVGFVTPAAFGIFGFVSDFLTPAPTSLIQGVGVGLMVFYFVRLRQTNLATAREVS